jgi:hypothetical protein
MASEQNAVNCCATLYALHDIFTSSTSLSNLSDRSVLFFSIRKTGSGEGGVAMRLLLESILCLKST